MMFSLLFNALQPNNLFEKQTDLKQTALLLIRHLQKLRLTNLTSEKDNRKRKLYLQAAENLITEYQLD